eukprot:scaffold38210_cov191-Amphora_coffeaeformis.AAC.7
MSGCPSSAIAAFYLLGVRISHAPRSHLQDSDVTNCGLKEIGTRKFFSDDNTIMKNPKNKECVVDLYFPRFLTPDTTAFLSARPSARPSSSTTPLFATTKKCTPLPNGLSPFEKSLSKSLDLQGSFRKIAGSALSQALRDGVKRMEIEFPPLLGGDMTKSQFDDFDNLQELNANRDWCVQLVPSLASIAGDCWLILPDDKEVELCKEEWTGQRYRSASKFTSIRAAVEASGAPMKLAWGSTLASTVNKLQGGDGILADSTALDELDPTKAYLHLVCQPGNGGPVEGVCALGVSKKFSFERMLSHSLSLSSLFRKDWINVENLSKSLPDVPLVVVNGALDKVRDGYYPAVFFPALAATAPYYKAFEPIFFLKPLSDKGLYGWLYRVYGEPWQVILQVPKSVQRNGQTATTVENVVALLSDSRPTYKEAVQAMLKAAS